MSKATVSYICGECGGHTLKWQGQCPTCGAWNTLATAAVKPAKRTGYAGEIKGLRLADVDQSEVERMSTGIVEFDRVLGGGPVVLGQGIADFDAFFGKLKEFDYQGPFIMQAYRDEEGVEIFEQQLEWVKPYLEQL